MTTRQKNTSWQSAKSTLLRFVKNAQTKPESFFACLALFCGLVMVFLIPPFMVPDESAHLYRAYQISDGHILSENSQATTGGALPVNLTTGSSELLSGAWNGGTDTSIPYEKWLKTPLDARQKTFAPFPETAVYSPVSYAPQTVGILLVKFFNPSVLVVLYAARIVNLMAFVILIFWAIRLIPVGKWVLAAVALLPMTIQQMASASPDVLTIGFIFLALACCLRLATQTQALSKKQLLFVAGIGLILGLTKQINALVLLPYFFLPKRLFGGMRRKLLLCAGLLAVAFGSALAWYAATKLLNYNFSYSSNPAVDIAIQSRFILLHPFSYLAVLFRTFFDVKPGLPPDLDFYWQSMVGYFSWFQYKLPLASAALAYLGLLAAFLYRPDSEVPLAKTLLKNRALCWALPVAAGLSIIALSTILYLMWSSVYSPTVVGLQGRYFIPYLPFLLLLFYRRISVNFLKQVYFPRLLGAIILLNFATTAFITGRFYNFF